VRADDSAAAARAQIHAARLRAQLLSGPPAASPGQVAGRLLAVQGQDGRGFRLAVRARTSGLTAADVDRALAAGSLVVTWLNRGTLHLIRREDYWLLHRLTVRPAFEVQCRRLLARSGVTDAAVETGVAAVARALDSDGPLTREQLRVHVAAAGLPAEGNVGLHVLAIASARGLAVRGPMIGAQHAYASVRDWLGPPPPEPAPEAALACLARRYLAGHGPASDRDLAKWAGLPLGHVRRGLAEISGELRDRTDGLAELAVADDQGDADGDPALPPARLLGPFDPVLLGWASREPILGDHQGIVTVNGLFRPFVLAGGRAVGTWGQAKGQLTVDWFADPAAAVRRAVEADAADVQRFLAGEAELA
jgi:DNA glycosylase AlkZ-like